MSEPKRGRRSKPGTYDLSVSDRLLLLLLLKLGATQTEIGWALDMHQGTISKRLAGLKMAKVPFGTRPK